jgi:hypothetical protein
VSNSPVRPDRVIQVLLGSEPRPEAEAEEQRFIRVEGLVGPSPVDGHTRLYSRNDTGSYVDIPTDKIRHVEPEDAERTPPEGTSLWVEADAGLRWPGASEASFLAGDIVDNFVPPFLCVARCHGPRHSG